MFHHFVHPRDHYPQDLLRHYHRHHHSDHQRDHHCHNQRDHQRDHQRDDHTDPHAGPQSPGSLLSSSPPDHWEEGMVESDRAEQVDNYLKTRILIFHHIIFTITKELMTSG